MTASFDLRQGLAMMSLSHADSGNFAVIVMSENGNEHLLVNTIGSYSGARAVPIATSQFFGLEPGPHRIEVTADGEWLIELEQPSWNSGQPPPLDWSGRGDNVISPLLLQVGLVPASFTHDGSGNFIVQLMSEDGSMSDLLVNTIGRYDGIVAVNVRENAFLGLSPGLYAIVIVADGSWTLHLGE